MRETTVQIDWIMSIFDDAGVEKQIERRDGVLRLDAKVNLGSTCSVRSDG